MTLWQTCCRWLAGPALVFSIAACGAIPRPPAVDHDARKAAIATVFSGYSNIADKYIDSLSVADIAIDGLKGLSAIDSNVTIARADDTIIVGSQDQEAWRMAAPPAGDVDGWTKLTVDAYAATRRISPAIANAPIEKIYAALFDGALSELDAYSHYASADQARRDRARRNGYGGIGLQVTSASGIARIIAVNKTAPAWKAGIRRNDVITNIDGQSTKDVPLVIFVDMLRGAAGTRVTLTIQRPKKAETFEATLARTLIVPRTVIAREHQGILMLRVTGFNQNTAHSLGEQIKKSRKRLGSAIKGIVLDLRGNPGGLLDQAIRIADLFLEGGNIIDTQGRHPASYQHYEAGGSDYAAGLPLVILIDGRSASSSEVLAAALQDQKRAVIIGTTSFGKGTVQTVIRLPNDGEMTLTWSRLVAPSGYALHGLGVHPSICTSGRGAADDKNLLQAAAATDAKNDVAFTKWRRVAISDLNQRDILRQACPAERRDNELDPKVARRVILDQPLYGQIIKNMSKSRGTPASQSALRPGS
jgi:carboxyl-terminal processing protease